MLVHVKILSLWEIAHYWHDYDPRESYTHQLPLKVRDTLLVLAMSYCHKINMRIEREKTYLVEVLKKPPRFTQRHYRHAFKKAIDSKVFGKKFFSNLFLSRSQLGRWCIEHNEPFPNFWFPDNKKYPFNEAGDISDEISVNGRYHIQLLYDDTTKKDEPEKSVSTTVNENAIKAANAKHAIRNAIKSRFIAFFDDNGSGYPSRKAAAEFFFDSLDEKNEKLLFEHKDAAVRTLLNALREHLKRPK